MEKREVVVPERGSELYKNLLDIFGDEDLLDVGLSEAATYFPRYLIEKSMFLYGSQSISTEKNYFHILIWVILKIQPDSENIEIKHRLVELARFIETGGINPNTDEAEDANQRFQKSKKAVEKYLSEKSSNTPKIPVGKVRRAPGISIKIAPARVSDEISQIAEKLKKMQERVKEMEYKIEEKEDLLKRYKEIICEQGRSCEQLLSEKKELVDRMNSKEFRDEVGQDYLLRMFKNYLKNARSWSQGRRDKEYDWLEHLLKIDAVPQDVKKMIEALAEDKGGENGSVNTHTYIEEQNNYYRG